MTTVLPVIAAAAGVLTVLAGFIYFLVRGFIRAARADPDRHEVQAMARSLLHRDTPAGRKHPDPGRAAP